MTNSNKAADYQEIQWPPKERRDGAVHPINMKTGAFRPSRPFGQAKGDVSPHDWDDPDWSILDDRRGELPDFPLAALPVGWRNWVVRSAHGAGVLPDYVIVPLLAISSSLVGTSRRVRPSASWSEPMTLWTAIVGFSGSGKTPGLDVTTRALSYIEQKPERRKKIAELQRQHDTEVQVAKAAEAAWKKEVKEAIEGGTKPPMKPAEAINPGVFVAPRLYVSDATIERLGVLLKGRPSGMLLIQDELAGLFLNMSRYSNGQDNEFWLQAYNGNHFVVERLSRPPVVIEHLLIGITGGFQPDKLSRSLSGDHDGMYGRICFSWPAEAPYRPLSDEIHEFDPDIINAIDRLVALSPLGEDFVRSYLSLTESARDRFEEFRKFNRAGRSDLDGREREWWSKGETHVLRLAGTLAFLEWSLDGGPEPTEIEERHIEAATTIWRDYFVPHSRAAIRRIGITQEQVSERRVLRCFIGLQDHL
jgi:hypothetical protein